MTDRDRAARENPEIVPCWACGQRQAVVTHPATGGSTTIRPHAEDEVVRLEAALAACREERDKAMNECIDGAARYRAEVDVQAAKAAAYRDGMYRLEAELAACRAERDNARQAAQVQLDVSNGLMDRLEAVEAELDAALGRVRALEKAAADLREDVFFSIESELESWADAPHPCAEKVRERLSAVLDGQRVSWADYDAALPAGAGGETGHPEDNCQRCGRANVVWHAPSDVWNKVNGSPNGVLCPVCFAQEGAKHGITSWRLTPDPAIYGETG